jgi:hypothetical protein
MINNIYQSKLLKYPLTDDEFANIEGVWKFMNKFKKVFVFISDYRNYIIKSIRKKYTIEEFFFYESILNKLFWNLRWLLFPLFENEDMSQEGYDKYIKNNYDQHKELPYFLSLCHKIHYQNFEDLEEKLKSRPILQNNFYRSFINKLIIVDKVNKIIYSKEMEGSSNIFSKNYFNLFTFSILFERELYEQIVTNPFLVKVEKIKLSQFYHEYDYAFPNLNYCTYEFGTKEERLERIEKMYYYKSGEKDKYWFKLLL